MRHSSKIERDVLLIFSLVLFLGFFSAASSSLHYLQTSNAQSGNLVKTSSGLVASDPLNGGISSYWTFGGDAPAEGAPFNYYEDSGGLHIGVEAPASNIWAGYFAVAKNLPFQLIHATITAPARTVSTGAFESGIYVQSSSGLINYVTCTSFTNSQGTFWEVVSTLGSSNNANQFNTLYENTSPNQPLTQDCTIITNGNNYLKVYFGSTLVYQSSSLNLQISEPFQVYLEPETSYAGAELYSSFLNYYITSSENVTLNGLLSNAAQAELINPTNGKVITTATVSGGIARLGIGGNSMPLQAVIEVFDSGNNLVASTSGAVGLVGGDVYSYSSVSSSSSSTTSSSTTSSSSTKTTTTSSSITSTTSVTSTSMSSSSTTSTGVQLVIDTVDQNAKAITGYYVTLTQSGNSIASGFSPATFQLQSGKTYTVTPENYGSYSFACWNDSKSTTASRSVSISKPTTLVAVYSNSQSLPPICSSNSIKITIQTQSLTGSNINGLYTIIYDSTGTNILFQGYSPVSFSAIQGQTYQVLVENYAPYVFDHWNNGARTNEITIAPISATTYIAYYST